MRQNTSGPPKCERRCVVEVDRGGETTYTLPPGPTRTWLIDADPEVTAGASCPLAYTFCRSVAPAVATWGAAPVDTGVTAEGDAEVLAAVAWGVALMDAGVTAAADADVPLPVTAKPIAPFRSKRSGVGAGGAGGAGGVHPILGAGDPPS